MADNLKIQIAPDAYVLAYKAKTYHQACAIATYLVEVQTILDIRENRKKEELMKRYPNTMIFDRCNN